MASCGHEIGNHGMSTSILPTDQEGIVLIVTLKASFKALEKEPAKLYPCLREVNEKIGQQQRRSAIEPLWERRHHRLAMAPAVIVQRVQRKIAPGGIVLMHPTENTVKALPEMLKMLAEKNLQPVTVGELLKAKASP